LGIGAASNFNSNRNMDLDSLGPDYRPCEKPEPSDAKIGPDEAQIVALAVKTIRSNRPANVLIGAGALIFLGFYYRRPCRYMDTEHFGGSK